MHRHGIWNFWFPLQDYCHLSWIDIWCVQFVIDVENTLLAAELNFRKCVEMWKFWPFLPEKEQEISQYKFNVGIFKELTHFHVRNLILTFTGLSSKLLSTVRMLQLTLEMMMYEMMTVDFFLNFLPIPYLGLGFWGYFLSLRSAFNSRFTLGTTQSLWEQGMAVTTRKLGLFRQKDKMGQVLFCWNNKKGENFFTEEKKEEENNRK